MATPTYSFTVPSLADDIALDCRLYFPEDLATTLQVRHSDGRGSKGAVVAHPYAPLGGSYDDSVVLSVTECLIEQGYVVTTFNFRGAGESAGRTSWTGKPEVEDYTAIAGFIIYFLHGLDLLMNDVDGLNSEVTPQRADVDPTRTPKPHLANSMQVLLAGYSFGSLILARLPPMASIVDRFESAEQGTAASEVFLRARTLAKQTYATLRASQTPPRSRGRTLSGSNSPKTPHSRASPMVVGGEETDPSERRSSREAKRDVVKEVPHRIKAHIRRHSDRHIKERAEAKRPLSAAGGGVMHGRPVVDTAYLLISPVLVPLTTSLLPPGLPLSLALPTTPGKSDALSTSGLLSNTSPALLLFGSSDSFTSARKLQHWAEKLARDSGGKARWKQIDQAGHFWREDGVMRALQSEIVSWTKELP